MASTTSTFARVFYLLTLALSFLSVVVAGPIPSEGAVAEVELEKRVTHSGVGTYYYQKGNAGACGWKKSDSALIVATSAHFWNTKGNHNCGQYVAITSKGKTVYAMAADECPECAIGHLDMSVALFKKFHPLSVGEFPITWRFMPANFKP